MDSCCFKEVERVNMNHLANFIEIGRTVVEISRLTVFKIAAIRHLGF